MLEMRCIVGMCFMAGISLQYEEVGNCVARASEVTELRSCAFGFLRLLFLGAASRPDLGIDFSPGLSRAVGSRGTSWGKTEERVRRRVCSVGVRASHRGIIFSRWVALAEHVAWTLMGS